MNSKGKKKIMSVCDTQLCHFSGEIKKLTVQNFGSIF